MTSSLRTKARFFILPALALALLANCATKTQTGVLIGAGAGTLAGGLIGKAAGHTATGAIIGAAVGGIAGGVIGAQMDKQAHEIAQNIPGARVERIGEGIAVTFESGMLYDYDSSNLRPEAQSNLRSLAASLGKYPGSDILIVGHTDGTGSSGYNQGLSERRAQSAANYLTSQGVSNGRVSTVGRGESEPAASNDTDDGRQQNRRVAVAIYASEAARAAAAQSGN
jgi:outer membrane protein OmpA-like peptidoglycan-associated protein